jgi:Methyltransferase domain
MPISLRWKRPAPLDVLAPAMQWGRFCTWINAVLKRPELLRNRERAWKIYAEVHNTLKTPAPIGRPSDWLARFADHILQAQCPRPVRYLEIGACQGHSTAFVYGILNGDVQITMVDPFVAFSEIDDAVMHRAQEVFLANMQAMRAQDKVRVLKGRSVDHLPNLIDSGEQFDIIYIDGSHATLDVLLDAALCWRLLPSGGLLIFDDYWYRRPDLGIGYRPKLAIDAFVGAMSHEIAVLDVARQVFLRKRANLTSIRRNPPVRPSDSFPANHSHESRKFTAL